MTVAKQQVAKVQTVTLQEQESGGASPHTHTVEFPDGNIGPGTWQSSVAQDHTHQIIVPDEIAVGDERTILSEVAVPDPPEGVTQHTHAVIIAPRESTANPPPEEEQVSQRKKRDVFQDSLDALRVTLGREPSAEMRKQLFDDVRAKASREDAFHVLQSRIEDLSKSVFDILFLVDEDDSADPMAMLQETMKQFVDSTQGELSDILAGRIIKHFGKTEAPPDPDEFQDLLSEFFEKSQAELVGEEQEEEGMDLSKLTPEDRAIVEKALEQASLVEQLTKSLEESKTKISELEKAVTAASDGGGGDEDDVTKGLPPKAAQFVKGLEAKNELLTKQVNEMADFSKKAVLRESIVSKLDSLAIGADACVDALWAIQDEEARAKVLKVLEAANVAVSKAGAFASLGSDATTGLTSAAAKFEALATEICKNDPKTTMIEARAKAITENPELYDEYMAEAEPLRYGAHH